MIEIRYRRILLFHAFFLLLLGLFSFYFFKDSLNLSIPTSVWKTYLAVWGVGIIFNLLFIKFFALPTEGLLKKLELSKIDHDLSWSDIEETLSRRDVHLQNLQSEYKIENLKFKILLDSLHDPVCIFNRDETILYSNQAFNSLFGLTEIQLRPPLLEVTRNFYFQDFVKKALQTNEVQKINEFSFSPIQDSFRKFFEIKIFPLKEIQNYLCIMHDVTERKMADHIREDFVANFSHEVRTPLTILNGQMLTLKGQLEKDPNFQEKFSLLFERVDNNSRRLINLFNDLLRLTSVERKKDIHKEFVEIGDLIESLLEEISQNYSHKKISFKLDLQVLTFFVDYNLFEQVLINLIDNAFKYIDTEGVITIVSREDGDTHILEVSDDGIGVPEDQVHRIFERFFRIDSSRSNAIEGTGLGLAIVKHIIQKHDGKIKAKSELNRGITFTISLPKS